MNKYEIAGVVAQNGLDDMEYRKLSAKQQRELFGFNVAGRRDVMFDSRNQGTVRVGKWTDPTNYSTKDYSYEAFAERINNHEQVEVW